MSDMQQIPTDGDSIWGRVTVLVSSLLGRRCTGKERSMFYEALLRRPEERSFQEESLDEIIDAAAAKLARIGDEWLPREFARSTGKLKKVNEKAESIIRFMLALADFEAIEKDFETRNEEFGDYIPCVKRQWSEIVDPCTSSTLLDFSDHVSSSELSFSSRSTPLSVRNTSLNSQKFKSKPKSLRFSKRPQSSTTDLSSCSSSSLQSSSILESRCIKMPAVTEESVADCRGNVYLKAVLPAFREQWRRISKSFYVIPLNEVASCIGHLLCNEMSFLFRRDAEDEGLSLYNPKEMCLEDDCPYGLSRIVQPFLVFAEKLFLVERFLNAQLDCVSNLERSRDRNKAGTGAFTVFAFHVKDLISSFRGEISELFASNKSNDPKGVLDAARQKCENISCLLEVVMIIEERRDFSASGLISYLYMAKATFGIHCVEAAEFFDSIIVRLLMYFDRYFLRWLHFGSECLESGVLCSNKEVHADKKVDIGKLWTANFGVCLPSNELMGESFCKKWFGEGKTRKLLSLWPTNEEYLVTDLVLSKLIMKDNDEEELERSFRRALQSSVPYAAIESLLNKRYLEATNSEVCRDFRVFILNSFRETQQVLFDVFLCRDGNALNSIICSLNSHISNSPPISNTSFTPPIKPLGIFNATAASSVVREINLHLVAKRYSRRTIERFKISAVPSANFNLKLSYDPAYPLSAIFTSSLLEVYSDIWSLLVQVSFECEAITELHLEGFSCDGRTMLIRSRMLNFLNAVREFLFARVISSLCRKYEEMLVTAESIDDACNLHRSFMTGLRRYCLQGRKRRKLLNVLDDCLAAVTEFREAVRSESREAVLSAFGKFRENLDLFCNVIKLQSAGNETWFADLLLLIDFTGLYAKYDEEECDYLE